MGTIVDNLFDEFVIEADELLDEIEKELLDFDTSSALSKNVYSKIFRNFHSLKGSSGMMGLDELQRHTHLLEDKFQSYENRLDEIYKFVDYFLIGVDTARDLLHGRKINFDFEQNEINTRIELSENLYSKELKINDSENPIFIIVGVEQKVESHFLSDFDCYYYKDLLQYCEKFKQIRNTIILAPKATINELKKLIDTTRNELCCLETINDDEGFIHLVENIGVKENLNKAILLLMYQQSDLENFLLKSGKPDILNTIKVQIKEILQFRNNLRNGNKK